MLRAKPKSEKEINGQPTVVRIWQYEDGRELVTYRIRIDNQGNEWYAFEDLYQLPNQRYIASKKVIELYGHGLHLDDIKAITATIKGILKSNDAEKYEKAFAKVLELEGLSESMADPEKQSLGLCTVYLLMNDERPDVYNNQVQSLKMSNLALDIESQAFFLTWWTTSIMRYGAALSGLSTIVSKASEMANSEPLKN